MDILHNLASTNCSQQAKCLKYDSYLSFTVLQNCNSSSHKNKLNTIVPMCITTVWIFLSFIAGIYSKNVLFITIDDLRPDLGCYQGDDYPSAADPPIYSPNIDALAKRSLLLKRAYVQQAVCSPSRTSFLTGRRPDTTRVYDLETYFRDVAGNFTTLPQYFKNNGHMSVGMGKIFHHGKASGHDDPISWSLPFYRPHESRWEGDNNSLHFVPDDQLNSHPLVDQDIAQHAIHTLRDFAAGGKYQHKPFFIGVGFIRPHLPFISPASFEKHYSQRSIKLPTNPYAPAHMPDVAWSHYSELRAYSDISKLHASGDINTTLPDSTVLDLRKAYFTAVSYVDSMVGKVIDELNRLGLGNNTIISLLGDHGWQLGEHGLWCKHTNFELATHAPLMVHIPGVTDAGIKTERLAEFVDLFPTLVEASGLPKVSQCPENSRHVATCTEGESLMPLVSNPTRPWKDAAFSQYPRTLHHQSIMGYTIRTDKYRYTEWPEFSKTTFTPNWTKLHGVELYDHSKDPDENINRAHYHAYADIARQLQQQLHAGWRAASPTHGPAIVG